MTAQTEALAEELEERFERKKNKKGMGRKTKRRRKKTILIKRIPLRDALAEVHRVTKEEINEEFLNAHARVA
jgi:hypothetical protein